MKTILVDYKNVTPRFDELSICLGYFDAVHLGHQELIKYARSNAKHVLGLITFDKPISTLITNGKSKDVVTSLDDRFKLISKLGVDYFLVFQIDKGFTELSDMDFIEILKKMNVKEVFVGKDFRYGKNCSGTLYELQNYFDVNVVDLKMFNNKKISTQDINNFISLGDLDYVKKILGRNYCVSGTMTEGNHIGRTIGFPTINLKLNDDYVLPKFGVYKCICYVDGVPHTAIANVGVKPTIGPKNEPIIEIHLKDVHCDVKGDVISLEFIDFIREEKKFSSLEELKQQIAKDVKEVF